MGPKNNSEETSPIEKPGNNQATLEAADHIAAWWKDGKDTHDLLERIKVYQKIRGIKFV